MPIKLDYVCAYDSLLGCLVKYADCVHFEALDQYLRKIMRRGTYRQEYTAVFSTSESLCADSGNYSRLLCSRSDCNAVVK